MARDAKFYLRLVECSECFAEGPARESKAQAAADWNRRVPAFVARRVEVNYG